MLGKEAQKALIGWEARGPRLITAFTTKKKKLKINIMLGYVPTNDSIEETKVQFCEKLQSALNTFGDRAINILMGDFNAKIGAVNTGYEEVMGKHGLSSMNQNGELFANACALNRYVIGGSVFPPKRIHLAMWVSPDHMTENQIDHICISKTFWRSLLDVRVMRGADVASDHHLVTAKLRLKLTKNGVDQVRARYNVNCPKRPKGVGSLQNHSQQSIPSSSRTARWRKPVYRIPVEEHKGSAQHRLPGNLRKEKAQTQRLDNT